MGYTPIRFLGNPPNSCQVPDTPQFIIVPRYNHIIGVTEGPERQRRVVYHKAIINIICLARLYLEVDWFNTGEACRTLCAVTIKFNL